MATANDFIQSFMQLAQARNQRQQVETQQAAMRTDALSQFIQDAQRFNNPAQLTSLVEVYAANGVAPKESLLGILNAVTPSIEAQKAYATQQGIRQSQGQAADLSATPEATALAKETAAANLTGMNLGQTGASQFLAGIYGQAPAPTDDQLGAFTQRQVTGMSAGDQAVDAARARLPADELEYQAGVGGGSRLTAGQKAQTELGWADLRQRDRQLAIESGLREAGLVLEQAKITMAANANGEASIGELYKMAPSLLDTQQQLQRSLQENRDGLTKVQLEQMATTIDQINQILGQMGLPVPEPLAPQGAEAVRGRSFFGKIPGIGRFYNPD